MNANSTWQELIYNENSFNDRKICFKAIQNDEKKNRELQA